MRIIHVIFLLCLLIFSCKKPPVSAKNKLLADKALQYKGVPYKFGGTNTIGMDCSGLVFKSFAELGKAFPRSSYEQAEVFSSVSKKDLSVGDLVYFKIGKTSRINHTGIVTKLVNSEIILFLHSSSSAGVREDNLYSNYWKPKFVKATRPKF